jgi:predicted secreted protein
VIVPGTPESAPTRPRLLRIVLLTTGVSSLLFFGIWVLDAYNAVDFADWIGRNAVR